MATRFNSIDLSLPPRDRDHLSMVKHNKAQMQLWVNALPVMNAAECGKQLYQTISELLCLDIDESLRFELLEVLQPTIHHLVTTLEKHTINQPLLLPVHGRRVFALILALRRQLAMNYKVVATETMRKLQGRVGFMDWGRRNLQQLAATAIQRTIAELQRYLLDGFRQYEESPTGLWADVHALCRVAETQGLIDLKVKMGGHGQVDTSVRQTYLATVLLEASQPNKLRQSEMELVYQYSQEWARLLELNNTAKQSLLVCNVDDTPPLYHHRVNTSYESLYVHSSALAAYFAEQIAQPTTVLPLSLLMHLYETWRVARERMFERTECHKNILLCIGMSSAHYYAGGQTAFKIVVKGEEQVEEVKQPTFLFGLEEEKVTEEQPDAWQVCYGSVKGIDQETDDDAPSPEVPSMTYMPYRVTAIDRCPAGYRIIWSEPPPYTLRVGEIIGMSEKRGEGWGVGVLHWLRQTSNKTYEAGVELLDAHPKPCGVCLVKNGKPTSDYMRGFLIPEMEALERPATLITINSGLTTNSMVQISINGQEVVAQLTKQVMATQSLSQFEFALLSDKTQDDDDDDEFNSTAQMWAKL